MYDIKQIQYQNTDENGVLINSGELKTKKANKMDHYDYYILWNYTYKEFYADGTIKSSIFSSYKSSTYGRNCGELISKQITFYENGQIATKMVDRCDCKRSKIKEWDESGKRIRTKKTRLKRLK
jgi:antitoxin component YwqK of YwqJK toxin-antitoxin module